jgi:hypothetical protein
MEFAKVETPMLASREMAAIRKADISRREYVAALKTSDER